MVTFNYDNVRGFSINSGDRQKQKRSEGTIFSCGFDLFDWDEIIPSSTSIEPSDQLHEEAGDNELKRQKDRRKKRKEQKKLNAARNRRLKRAQESQGMASSKENGIERKVDSVQLMADIKYRYSSILKQANSNQPDFKILQYHSIALYKSDLNHFLPEDWLNDNNISIIYEVLHQNFLKKTEESPFVEQVHLLYPSLVQLFLHFPIDSGIESILPVEELKRAKFIFIPINFIEDFDTVNLEDDNNGDHWALCLLCTMNNTIYLYDSMYLENEIADSDKKLLNELIKRLEICKIFGTGAKLKVQQMACDQQDNFDDCGVYLLMITCYLIKQFLWSEGEFSLNLDNVKFNPLEGRFHMLDLMHRLIYSDDNIRN